MRACEQGLRLRYARCVDLLDDLHAGLADGSYPRRFKSWAVAELLVIDDVGLGQVNPKAPPKSLPVTAARPATAREFLA